MASGATDVFAAVADPTRRHVLELLSAGERTAGELVEAFPDRSQPAISRQLRILRDAGLIEARPAQQQRIYSLRPERLAELDRWIATFRPFWLDRLDALENHLARTARSRTPTRRKPRR